MGKQKETPESLYKFFQELDAGEDEDGGEVEVSYASGSVVRRGREATRMLVAVQQILNLKSQPAKSAETAEDGDGDEIAEELRQELDEAQAEVDRLLVNNSEQIDQIKTLNETNKRLKEKISVMQRQIERLYNKREMAKTLGTIEGKRKTEVEKAGEDGDEDEEEVSEMKKFAQDLDNESAARAPQDEDDE